MDTVSATTTTLLLRLVGVFGATCAQFINITPPNPQPTKQETRRVSVVEKNMIGTMKFTMQFSYLFAGVAEIVLIIMRLSARMAGSTFLASTCVEKLEFTPLAILGCILAGIGIIMCYQTLGRLFTFELAILPNHKLITSGPYTLVRHPSYMGAMVLLAGITLVYGTQGSMMYHCPVGYELWALLWSALVIFSSLMMGERCLREDCILRATFGRDWEEWSQRVRWKLIPPPSDTSLKMES
ncbi:hypothetical protein BKA82DRAFT_961257 [Pisolithus tinctorius]|nr:hypothetical protein BKA82DRAFT_961257 [Pisolithus tinctorius]